MLPTPDFTMSLYRRLDYFLPVRGKQDGWEFQKTLVPFDQFGLRGPFAFPGFTPAAAIALQKGPINGLGQKESQQRIVHGHY
jgi:hypothetical protein